MPDWPLPGMTRRGSGGGAMNAHANAHTKGAWLQAVAPGALPTGVNWLMINGVSSGPTATQEFLVDIGIGAAGSEIVVVSNLHIEVKSGNMNAVCFPLPFALPAGERVAIRCQCSVAGSVQFITYLEFFSGPTSGFGKVDTYGADVADSGGVLVDPGASAGTWGAWAEIAASIDEMRALLLCIGSRSVTSGRSGASAYWTVDLATGAAGSERPFLHDGVVGGGNFQYHVAHDSSPVEPQYQYWPIHVPSGSRLSARAVCGLTSATARLIDVIVYGLR